MIKARDVGWPGGFRLVTLDVKTLGFTLPRQQCVRHGIVSDASELRQNLAAQPPSYRALIKLARQRFEAQKDEALIREPISPGRTAIRRAKPTASGWLHLAY